MLHLFFQSHCNLCPRENIQSVPKCWSYCSLSLCFSERRSVFSYLKKIIPISAFTIRTFTYLVLFDSTRMGSKQRPWSLNSPESESRICAIIQISRDNYWLKIELWSKLCAKRGNQRLFCLRKLSYLNIDKTKTTTFYRAIIELILSFSLMSWFGNLTEPLSQIWGLADWLVSHS